MAFRVNAVPLSMAIAFGLIWRTYRLGGVRLAVGAGAALGLCFYTYLSARFAYPLALLVLGLLALTEAGRARLAERRRELVWIAAICMLVMLPLALYFAVHPDDFLRRASMVTVGAVGEDPYFMRLLSSVFAQFGMFGGPGDPEVRHNLPGRSILSPWLALLFWTGVGLAVLRIRRPGRLIALLWLIVMLLPAILSVSDPRHMLRAFSVLPVLYLFPSLAIGDGWKWLATRRLGVPRTWVNGMALVIAASLIAIEALLTGRAYFDLWANLPELPRAFRSMDTAIAEEINQAPGTIGYVVPLAPLWRGLGGNYTLDYLIERPENVLLLYPDSPDAGERLLRFLARPDFDEVRLVRYTWAQDADADPKELLPLLAGLVGESTDTREESDYVVQSYVLRADRPVLANLPPIKPLDLIFSLHSGTEVHVDSLQQLTIGGATGGDLPSGGSGAIALEWQMTQSSAQELRLSLRLIDELGKPVGQADSLLIQAGESLPEDRAKVTYHPLHAAPGTPPGTYGLELIIYEGTTGDRLSLVRTDPAPRDAVVIGSVRVGMPDADGVAYRPPDAAEQPVEIAPNVILLGGKSEHLSGKPGLPLDLTLAWRQEAIGEPSELYFLLDDEPIREETLDLPLGGPWRTTHRLYIPAQTDADAYTLSIAGTSAAAPLGTFGVGEPAVPAEISAGRPMFRFADGIELMGWLTEDNPLAATLYWRANSNEARPDYTVFIHIFDSSGQIIVQDDAEPAGGRYPTSSWPAQTDIADQHKLMQPDNRDLDELCIQVGLYLAGSEQRLPLLNGGKAAELSSACRR
jgi:hypothetical protein